MTWVMWKLGIARAGRAADHRAPPAMGSNAAVDGPQRRERVMKTALCALAGLALAAAAQAAEVKPADKARVVAQLKANAVVAAALRQAQDFVGTRDCRYDVLRVSATPLVAGQSWTYEAEIHCSKDEAAAVVRVMGSPPLAPRGPAELQVSLAFAG